MGNESVARISCGYLPLLKQCSLTLSINYSVSQPCPYNTPINSVHPRLAEPRGKATAPLAGTLDRVRLWDPLAIATSAQVRVRSKQVMNSPLNQYYVTCMLVSRPIEDTTRYRG